MDISYIDKMKAAERVRDEKWKYHRETDEREKVIDDYNKENEMKKEQIDLIRGFMNKCKNDGVEFKKEDIGLILKYDEYLKEKQPKIKRIELDER